MDQELKKKISSFIDSITGHYDFSTEGLDLVHRFLNEQSMSNHDLQCLIYEFTKSNKLDNNSILYLYEELFLGLNNCKKKLEIQYENGLFTSQVHFYQLEVSGITRLQEFINQERKRIKPSIKSKKGLSKSANVEGAIKPIVWLGTPGQLVFLFDELRDNNFLALSEELHARIRDHFVDKNGNPFKHLKNAKQNYLSSKTEKPKQSNLIEKIVSDTKNKK